MFNRKPKQIKIALTSKGLEQQAVEFLASQGFPTDQEGKRLFAAFIQHLPQDQDSFDPELLGRMMRKAKANELAFYMMHPEKAPTEEQTNDKEGTAKTSEEVVQQAG